MSQACGSDLGNSQCRPRREYNRVHVTAQFLRAVWSPAVRSPGWRVLNHNSPSRPSAVVLERSNQGQPHKGKVLLALQAHSDDIPLSAAGTVAKLIEEGYTGYLVRATNDDMGDAPGLGTPGTIGEHVLGNERDNARSGARSRLQVALRSELQQPPHGRCVAQRVDRPPDFPDSAGAKPTRLSAGILGRTTKRIPITTLLAKAVEAAVLDGRSRARLSRSTSPPDSSRKPCRTNTISRAVPRLRE